MDIATISVIASAAVALGSLGVTAWNAERQRKHERGLDFEQRVWEEKSKALFAIIEQCREFLDLEVRMDRLDEHGHKIISAEFGQRLDRLTDQMPTVEAFASQECREALHDLVAGMRAGGVKRGYGSLFRQLGEQARSTDDANERGRIEQRRWDLLDLTSDGFDLDMQQAKQLSQRLLDAARQSARTPSTD